jgi:TPP-dependent pyruvate/acetoin dehydrogenase alpha subunit
MPTVTSSSSAAITREHGARLLHEMLRIRRFEERCAELHRHGHIRMLPANTRNEAVAVGTAQALVRDDALVTTHGEHGYALARGCPMTLLMASTLDTSRPRRADRRPHLFDPVHRFFGSDSLVDGFPLAVGMAMADVMHQRPHVTACCFSDESVARGEFHDVLSLAVAWKLPVLFVYEKCTETIGYPVPADTVDGMDVFAVEAATRAALDAIRAGAGPRFLDCRAYQAGDPIRVTIARLKADGLISDTLVRAIEDSVAEEVAEAVAFAEE